MDQRGIAQGQTVTATYPVIDTFTIEASTSTLLDAFALAFSIWDISTPAKQAAPVQVYPVLPDTRAAINLVTNRLGVGHYFAPWAVPSSEAIGRHEVRWYMTPRSAAAEVTWRQEFDVLTACARRGGGAEYALVSDLRDEGISVNEASDARLQQIIAYASRYIDKMTGRFFMPRYQRLALDGKGGRALLLQSPIIAVENVFVTIDDLIGTEPLLDRSFYKVYNRHLTSQLTDPDDRESPKLEFIISHDVVSGEPSAIQVGLVNLHWPRGSQNAKVNGLFGYTDWDDSAPFGRVPDMLTQAVKLLANRNIPKLAEAEERETRMNKFRVSSERDRDQSIMYDTKLLLGSWSGDWEIDSIIASFARPPRMAAC